MRPNPGGGPPPRRPAPPGTPGTARPGRRWPRRLLIGLNILLIVVIAGAAVVYSYAHYRLGQIKKVGVAGERSVSSGQPMTILVAGSDSRADESSGAAEHFGSASEVGGQRSDVILLVHIDPATDSASMLSIPRDTAVTLAGSQDEAKINDAFNSGPSELVQTITQTFGIVINHVVQVTFGGVEDIDQAVGGVCMDFPYPARDGSPTGYGSESGLDIPTAGQHVLNGSEALALIRSRYYQYYKDGEWIPEGTGDLGRIIRQHTFLRALASKALHESVSNPFKANALAVDAVHDVTVDKAFSTDSILALVTEMHSLKPSTIPSWTLPTSSAYSYALGDYLVPDQSEDTTVIHDWATYTAPKAKPAPAPARKSSTSTTVAPSSITLSVKNGSGVAGQAGDAAQDLTSDGFNVSGTGDASNFSYTDSVVLYGSGAKSQARTVAAFVGGPVEVKSSSSLHSGQVELVTGSRYTGINAPASFSTTTTTTTPSSSSPTSPDNSSVPPWDPTPCSS